MTASTPPHERANLRLNFFDAVTPIVWELFAWNNPYDEHTRHQLRAWLEEVVAHVSEERDRP